MPSHLKNLTHLPPAKAYEKITDEIRIDTGKPPDALAQEQLDEGKCYFEGLAEITGLELDLIQHLYRQRIINVRLANGFENIFNIGGFLQYKSFSNTVFPGYGNWDLNFIRDPNMDSIMLPEIPPGSILKNSIGVDSLSCEPLRVNPASFNEFLNQITLGAYPILHDYLHNLFPEFGHFYPIYVFAEQSVGICRVANLMSNPFRHYETFCQAIHASMVCNTTALTPLRKQLEQSVERGLEIVNELLREAAGKVSREEIAGTKKEFFRFFAWLAWHCPTMDLPNLNKSVFAGTTRRYSIFRGQNFQREVPIIDQTIVGFNDKLEPPSEMIKRFVADPKMAGRKARTLILSLPV
jgi:hypothetical protein